VVYEGRIHRVHLRRRPGRGSESVGTSLGTSRVATAI
jgi:hypothetical protein